MSKLTGPIIVLILSTVGIIYLTVNKTMSLKKLLSVDFEVYGIVQGVFFRKYTEKQSKSLGLRGWCMNTDKGTVKGSIEGEETAVKDMKKWLQSVGSPSSRIDKCNFVNEREILKFTFDDFKIRR